MFGSPTLEAILGLLLTYVVLSWACAVLNELMAAALVLRARYLERGLRSILQAPDLIERFYEHPLIKVLHVGDYRPAYLPARTFALALIDILAPSPSETANANTNDPYYSNASGGYAGSRLRDMEALRQAALSSADSSTAGVVHACVTFIDEAAGDFERFRANLEGWFESTMEQVSGMYKRMTFINLLLISLTLATVLNADSINIARTLAQAVSPDRFRASLLESAAARYAEANPAPSPTPLTQQYDGLPLGWAPASRVEDPRSLPLSVTGWFQKILGLVLTALVLTLGATFWYDLLNKFVFVRTAVKPRELLHAGPAQPLPSQTEVKVYSDYSAGSG